jgi:hypothetical protein
VESRFDAVLREPALVGECGGPVAEHRIGRDARVDAVRRGDRLPGHVSGISGGVDGVFDGLAEAVRGLGVTGLRG